jgi:hypothetical protein
MTGIDDAARDQPYCWCCGTIAAPVKLVHLGNHPEVTVCTRCAHTLSTWAGEIEDRDRTGVNVRVRDQIRRVRKTVVAHGWHQNRFVGRPLRWLGRHTP